MKKLVKVAKITAVVFVVILVFLYWVGTTSDPVPTDDNTSTEVTVDDFGDEDATEVVEKTEEVEEEPESEVTEEPVVDEPTEKEEVETEVVEEEPESEVVESNDDDDYAAGHLSGEEYDPSDYTSDGADLPDYYQNISTCRIDTDNGDGTHAVGDYADMYDIVSTFGIEFEETNSDIYQFFESYALIRFVQDNYFMLTLADVTDFYQIDMGREDITTKDANTIMRSICHFRGVIDDLAFHNDLVKYLTDYGIDLPSASAAIGY